MSIITVHGPNMLGPGGAGGAPAGARATAAPTNTFAADAGITASNATNAAKLYGEGFIAAPLTAWTGGSGPDTGQKIVIGTFAFHWNGSEWKPGDASRRVTAPGATFTADAHITASDAPNAILLAGEGFVALPTTAWVTGQKMTVGTYDFYWDGTRWQPGTSVTDPPRGTAAPGQSFVADSDITASNVTTAALLTAEGFVALPLTAWTVGAGADLGQKILIGTKAFYWNGSAWKPGDASRRAAAPAMTFAADTEITASDSTNAARLAGEGFVANPLTAWTTGQSITIGGFAFNWTSAAWAAGAHA